MTVSIKAMLEAGVHLGHKKRYRNPKMDPYIYGDHYGIHIIDLTQTKELLDIALRSIVSLSSKGGKILFVGTKPAAQWIIEESANQVDMPYVSNRWPGGMLTNYKTIRNSIKKLDDLDAQIESGQLKKLTKKEMLMELRKREKLVYNFGGIRKMKGLPDALFVIDVNAERIAITEAKKLGIPVIGIVDSNASPHDIDFIIPGNDDSVLSIQYYLGQVVAAIEKGKQKIKAQAPTKQTIIKEKKAEKPATAKVKKVAQIGKDEDGQKQQAVADKITSPEKQPALVKEAKSSTQAVDLVKAKKKAEKKPAAKKKATAKSQSETEQDLEKSKASKKADDDKSKVKKEAEVVKPAAKKPASSTAAKKAKAKPIAKKATEKTTKKKSSEGE